ncbi:MAG: hypothetical protein WCV55_00855 [Candidatus Paceibacterota bacterium]
MKTKKNIKIISQRLKRNCAVCCRCINAIIYSDKTYRGGWYYFKVPISTKKEWKRVMDLGTKKERMCNMVVNVLKEDPKPYKEVEYWECSKCHY